MVQQIVLLIKTTHQKYIKVEERFFFGWPALMWVTTLYPAQD